jgi:RND family efflux transporter MFP subunit
MAVDELIRLGLNNAAWAAALALVAAGGTMALRRRPAVAHTLWLLVLVKLVSPSLVSVDFPGSSALGRVTPPRVESTDWRAPGSELEASGPAAPSSAPLRQTKVAFSPPTVRHAAKTTVAQTVRAAPDAWTWRPLMVACWLTGACAWWAIVGLSSSRFRRLTQSAGAAAIELEDRVSHLAARLSLRHVPTIGMVPARVSPMLWTPLVGSPRIILPEKLWARLDTAQQDTVLVHELAHLKRRDHWVRRLEALVIGLYWWNPVAWWARREVERSEEECCDAWVAWALPAAVDAYAEALVTTAVFLSGLRQPLPVLASNAGRTLPLKRRLNMLVFDETSRSISGFAPRLLLGIGVLSLPFLPTLASARSAQESAQAQATPSPKGSETTKGTEPKNESPGLRVIQPALKVVGEYVDVVDASPLAAMKRIEIRSQAKGLVLRVHCKPAQRVKKGDILFEIDPATYRVQLQKAEAEVRRFQARLKRMSAERARVKEQRQQNIVGEAAVGRIDGEIDEAEASLQEAQANRDLAQLNLDSTRVKTPIDGVLTSVIGIQGDFAVSETTVLARMISQDLLDVTLYVDENVVSHLNRLRSEGKIKSEIPVVIGVRDEEGFPHRGSIDFVDVEVQPTGQVRLRALIPNPDGALPPGLKTRARILLGSPHTALVVPDDAVISENGRRFVLALNDQNILEKRFVSLGLIYDGLREIERGLKAEEWVLQSGTNYSWDGKKVQPKRVTWP